MNYSLNDKTYEADEEGYLRNLDQWDTDIANLIAQREGIQLKAEHWEIITSLQNYFNEYDHSPAMRPLIKYIKLNLSPDKANSIYLMTLFPGSPAKLAAKIAGLPRPENCL